jgi:hypothetical protein
VFDVQDGHRQSVADVEKPQKLKPGCRHECYRAVSNSSKYWLRRSSEGWRLLIFDASGYVGATNHLDLQGAREAAEQL